MTFDESDAALLPLGHFADGVDQLELKVLHRSIQGGFRRLPHLLAFQQIDGDFCLVMIAYQCAWPDDQLRCTVVVAYRDVSGIQSGLIQQVVSLFSFRGVGALGRVDKFVVDVFGISPELVKHLFGFAAQFLESGRKISFEIDFEIDVIVQILQNFLGSVGKSIAFFAGQVEAGKHINSG